MTGRGPILVTCADPCTVAGKRFPRERRFMVLREAERYALRGKRFSLPMTIGVYDAASRRAGMERDSRHG